MGTEWEATKLFGAFVAHLSDIEWLVLVKAGIMSKRSKEKPTKSESESSEEEEVTTYTTVC